MKRMIIIAVVCLCVTLASGFVSQSAVAQGRNMDAAGTKAGNSGGKVDPTTATIQFWDRSTDQIRSDGSSYTGKVEQNYPEQKILISLVKTRRFVSYDYRNVAPTDCDADIQSPEGILLKDSGTISIIHAGDMAPGTTAARRAVFFTSTGQFNYGDRLVGTNDPGINCSFEVVVTRVNQTTWTVTTDAAPGQTMTNFDGNVVPVGNRNQLQDGGGNFVGNYLMSFGMTVTCPLCK